MLNGVAMKTEESEIVCGNESLPSSSSHVVWMDNEKIFPKLEADSDDMNIEAGASFDSIQAEHFQHVSLLK